MLLSMKCVLSAIAKIVSDAPAARAVMSPDETVAPVSLRLYTMPVVAGIVMTPVSASNVGATGVASVSPESPRR